MQFDLELSQLRESQEMPLRLCFNKDRLTLKRFSGRKPPVSQQESADGAALTLN